MTSSWKDLSAALLLIAAVTFSEFFAGVESSETKTIHSVRRHEQNSKPWKNAQATFYEGDTNSFGGACNYKDVVADGYGTNTAALSSFLFKDGENCGACFEIQCSDTSKGCKPENPTLVVTGTDHCPPNSHGGWCDHPKKHFDIAKPAFSHLAEYETGVVPVKYRRVKCKREGGIQLKITGNPYFYQVTLTNVGGAGKVVGVKVKGHDKLDWTDMERDWGSTWKTSAILQNESLTFKIKTSDKKTLTLKDIAPQNWEFGKTFVGDNFH